MGHAQVGHPSCAHARVEATLALGRVSRDAFFFFPQISKAFSISILS
jgi:hypothetical protein